MSPGTRIKVLTASDSEAAWLVSRLEKLKDDGFEWDSASSTELDGLTADFEQADVIIVDTSISPDTAESVLHELMIQHNSTPVILCVENGFENGYSGAVRKGAQDFIVKNADSAEVIHRIIINAIDRSQILRATQESEGRVRAIIENISDGILIVDEAMTILFANPACEHLLNRTLFDLLGAPFDLDIPKESDSVVEIEQNDSVSIVASLRWVPIRWEGRHVRLYTIRDISAEHEVSQQLQRTKDEAQRLASLKSSFLANMSHELRMPLASIIGFAQLIEEGVEHPDFKEFATTIIESGNRLLETINSVLDLTQLDANAYQQKQKMISVGEMVDEVTAGLKPLMDQKMLPVEVVIEGNDSIKADPLVLNRIFNNLIGNAIKFTESGEIRVMITGSEDRVRCDVSDTGIGIDEAFLPHVFDEFAQESMGRNRSFGGTGLGLAITQRLVESMHATITVTSQKNSGTTFSIDFPRSNETV